MSVVSDSNANPLAAASGTPSLGVLRDLADRPPKRADVLLRGSGTRGDTLLCIPPQTMTNDILDERGGRSAGHSEVERDDIDRLAANPIAISFDETGAAQISGSSASCRDPQFCSLFPRVSWPGNAPMGALARRLLLSVAIAAYE